MAYPLDVAFQITNIPGTTGGFVVGGERVQGSYRATRGVEDFRLPRSIDDGASRNLYVLENDKWEVCASVYSHSTLTWTRGALLDSTGAAVTRQAFTSEAIVHVIGLSAAQVSATQALVSGAGLLLPRYRAALAATSANTADTRIAYLGDSTVAGAYGSGVVWANCRTFSPPVLIGNWLKQSLGLPVSLDAAFGQGDGGGAQVLYDPRVTRRTWTGLNDGNPGGLGGGGFRNDTNEAASVDFAFSDTFDTIEVDYLTNASGANFTISINQGAGLGAVVSSTGGLALVTATRTCTPGAHTVNINRQAGAGFMCIFAVRVRSSTTRRVLVWNWGSGGTTVANWLDTANVWSGGSYGPALAPHLVIVQLGINDAIAAVSNATALTNYQALVDLYRPFADVAFVTPTPVAAGSASLANQRAVITACRNIAQQNGVPLIDAAAIFGTQPAAQTAGLFLPANDLVHPGPTGYAAIASAVTRLPGLLR